MSPTRASSSAGLRCGRAGVLPLLALLLALGSAAAESCGRESIPYLISVDLHGKPGECVSNDRLTMTGRAGLRHARLLRAAEESAGGGGRRLGRAVRPAVRAAEDGCKPRPVAEHAPSLARPLQTCTGRYTDAPCASNDEWTGGVAEYNNGTHISLTMECCRFEGLNFATEFKVVMVHPGERFAGGPVQEKGRLVAFDLIKEVRKNVSPNNESVFGPKNCKLLFLLFLFFIFVYLFLFPDFC